MTRDTSGGLFVAAQATDPAEDELAALAHAWDRAMVQNDAEAIGRYMADDWTIIGADGSTSDKVTFLGLVKSGVLSHDVMESEELSIRLYGSTAVVFARGVSGGAITARHFASASCHPTFSSGRPTSGSVY
jgi:ketosteroid isomerase-like protein